MNLNKFLTGKITGIPVFTAVMLLTFHLTFNVAGKFLSDLLAAVISKSTAALSYRLLALGVNPAFHRLIIDGICAGVGSVLSFVPIIAVLFFLLSLLEESGYLPSVAVLLDRPMMKLGLTGRCVVPLIMSFGCAVPAVITAGSMLPPGERNTAFRLIPFMSCSARLPIYAMFTAAFFQNHRVSVMAGIYAAGIAIAVIYALIMKTRRQVPHTEKAHNTRVSYTVPNMRHVLFSVWINSKSFVKKAFTVIFMASVITWFLQSFDLHMQMTADSGESILAAMGKAAAPVFTPLGFGDWRAAAAVIAGLSAKEAVVSTFAVLSGPESAGSSAVILADIFSPAGALSFMVFCLLYMPCIATLAAVKNQTGSWNLSIRMLLTQTCIAWFTSFIVYKICLIL